MNTIDRPDVASVLAQMRTMREAASGQLVRTLAETDGPARVGAGPTPVAKTDFGATLRSAIGAVNSTQLEASGLTDAFVRGETDDLVKVMVAAQKSNVAFQAVTQVRNRLVSAYQDIMNMPI
jgi:flagellar hook-basal body complex protein FliE